MNEQQEAQDWRRYAWLLAAGYAFFYLVILGFRPLLRLDELRYAAAAQEMLARGDWITPYLNGVRYFEKPVLGYWLGAISQAVFGETAFAVRLPSALATGFTALFIGWFAQRVDTLKTAVFAAFIYLGCVFVYGIGTTNILDPILNLWLTVAVGLFYLAQTERDRQVQWLALCGAACGLAFLTKGFLAFAVPVVIAVPFLLWQRHYLRLLTDAWLPILMAALVVSPWALAIHLREADYWHYFFWVEHIQRFFSAASEVSQHKEPAWYFLVRFPLLAWPWFFLLPASILGLRRGDQPRSLVIYLGLWLIMPFLFFSSSSGKLTSYVLPCMPAFALLTALGLQQVRRDHPWLRGGVLLLAGAYATGVLFLLLNGLGLAGERLVQDYETGRWLGAMAAFAIGLLSCLWGWSARGEKLRLLLVGISFTGVMFAAQFVIPDSVRWSKSPDPFLREQAALTPAEAVLVADGSLFRSVNWAFRRHGTYMLDIGELKYGLSYPEHAQRLLGSRARVQQLLDRYLGEREIVFATKESQERIYAALLPANAHREQWGEAVVWRIPAD